MLLQTCRPCQQLKKVQGSFKSRQAAMCCTARAQKSCLTCLLEQVGQLTLQAAAQQQLS